MRIISKTTDIQVLVELFSVHGTNKHNLKTGTEIICSVRKDMDVNERLYNITQIKVNEQCF